MRSLRMTLLTVAVAATALGTVGVAPALALPKSDKTADTLTFVGSDTIQYVDDALCAAINDNTYLDNPKPSTGAKDTCVNVHAFAGPGEAQTVTAPADAYSPACTWSITPGAAPAGSTCSGSGAETAPVGSGAGAARLEANPGGDASVDVSRASSYQCNSSTRPNLECYDFARDAVGFATNKAGLTLTVAQIQGIYSCSITSWSQIDPKLSGTIERFFPQAGSGTGSFFVSNFLGGVDPRLSTSCPATQVAENDGRPVTANGIVPFSAGSWIAQGNKVTPDVRAAVTIGKVQVGSTAFAPVSGTAGSYKPNTAAFAEGSAYPGARYVFHNIDTRSKSYAAALRFVGFDAAGKSALCSGKFSTTLKKYGFLPLTKTGTGGACRLNVAA